MYRRWKDSKGKDKEYEHIIRYLIIFPYVLNTDISYLSCPCSVFKYIIHFFRKQVQASRLDAEREGVVIPTTMEEYCKKAKNPDQLVQENIDMDDLYDDDYDLADDCDDDEEDEDDCGSDTAIIRSEDQASDSCDNVNEGTNTCEKNGQL